MNDFHYLKKGSLGDRRKYIGASEVPTLALLNLKYGQSPYTLWETMTGRKEQWKGNTRTYIGNEIEPLLLKWGIADILGNDEAFKYYVSRIKGQKKYNYLHSFTGAICPQFSRLVAHADLISSGENEFILEAKNTGLYGGKRSKQDEDGNYGYDFSKNKIESIPTSVSLQCKTQSLCYGIKDFYVTTMTDGGIKKTFGPFRAKKKEHEYILALVDRFWWHVDNDTPPKPEIWKDVVSMYPEMDIESKTVVIGEQEQYIIDMKDKAAKLRKQEKEIKAELDDIKNAIGLIIGANKYLENSEGKNLATAFDVTRENIKLSELKEIKKSIYTRLKKEGIITESSFRNLKF